MTNVQSTGRPRKTSVADDRKIVINWEKPSFGGDGKAYMALLALVAAYCYLCTLSEDECQDTKRVMKGMPITKQNLALQKSVSQKSVSRFLSITVC